VKPVRDFVGLFQRKKEMITERDKRLADPYRIAVLVIDMHKGHLGTEDPRDALCPTLLGRTIIPALESFLEDARALNIPVVFARFTARREFVDCKMKFWCSEKILSGMPRFHELNVEPVPDDWYVVRPRPEDYTVTSKKRYSAFYGTDLEILLRRLGIETVVLTGIDTDVCVLSTAWDAVNRDFLTFILRNCTHCNSEEDKQAALQIMGRWVGWVMDSGEFLEMVKELRAERAATEKQPAPARLGEDSLGRYMGECVLADLRRGTVLSGELVDAMIDMPVLDAIRGSVTPGDRVMLFDLLGHPVQSMRRIAACLAREVIQEDDLPVLLQRFHAESDFYIRVALIYSILHKLVPGKAVVLGFLDYLDSEGTRYVELCKQYYGGRAQTILERMVAPAHRNKTVLYLHYLGLLGDSVALETLQSLRESDDDLIVAVAATAASRIQKAMRGGQQQTA
jgi:nicotinamidase-related amidase